MSSGPRSPQGPVILDLQAVQSRDYGERGVARHALEFARALQQERPDLLGGVMLNPRLAVPPSLEAFARAGKLHLSGEADLPQGGIYHVIAPFELEQPLEALWPGSTMHAGMRLVATLHDLIPRIFPEHYHADPGLRRRYLAREELVRAAERVLSVSETTRNEAIARLDLAPHRVHVIGAGISPAFCPPASRDEAYAQARSSLAALEPGFLLYVGGVDHRKNLEGLLAAYAALPPELRARHQLVIACRMGDDDQARLGALASRLGIAGRLLLSGYVADPTLIALYQATELFVFPSLYEGFGLPVAEAMACGALVVAAGTSATAELAHPAGQFDPTDAGSMAAAIQRALSDPATRAALREASGHPAPTWSQAVHKAVVVYQDLLAGPGPSPRRRLRIGFVTPLPPQPTGVAVYSQRLLEALAVIGGAGLEIDVFLDALEGGAGPLTQCPRLPAGTTGLYPVEYLSRVEAARGGYDLMVYAIGNSEFHTGALGAARQRPGIVLAHDVALAQLYAFAAHHGVLERSFGELFAELYPDAPAPPDPLLVNPAAFNELPQAMAGELLESSLAFLTTSQFAAQLARAEVSPEHRDSVGVLVHACRVVPARPPLAPEDRELLASFGVVNPTKDGFLLLKAFARVLSARPKARLVFVGQASAPDLAALADEAKRLAVDHAVSATGGVDAPAWDRWLSRTCVAVQLRRRSNGEYSGAIAECLAFGVPTIVTSLGAAGELAHDVAVAVPVGIAPEALADEILALLGAQARQRELAAGGRAYAAARSFPVVAQQLHQWIQRLAGAPLSRPAPSRLDAVAAAEDARPG